MATTGRGDPRQSPYEQRFADYQGAAIGITIEFNNGTRVIDGGVVQRDQDCLYSRILVGVGEDGNPGNTEHQWSAPPGGSTTITAEEFAAHGFTTIEEFDALQITAAP